MSSIRILSNNKFTTETKVDEKKTGFTPVIKTMQVNKRAVISSNFRTTTVKRNNAK
jgi:hypothetical protein